MKRRAEQNDRARFRNGVHCLTFLTDCGPSAKVNAAESHCLAGPDGGKRKLVTIADFSSHPVVDPLLTEEFFAPSEDPQTRELQLRLWRGIRSDVEDDVRRAASVPAPEMARHLHRVVGYVSTAGLVRLSACLRAWENHPEPAAVAEEYSSHALVIAADSLAAIERIYPHLAAG
jgi:hypothetical protein